MVSGVVQVMHDAPETYYPEKEDGSIFNDEVASTTSTASTLICTFTSKASARPTQGGKLLFQMLGEFAEFERSMIVERVKAGLKRVRAEVAAVARGLCKSTLGQPNASEDNS
jgi:DNA invertase Pin-like site-specific DNA recombinase